MSIKPAKPVTAYFRFLSDIKTGRYADQINDTTKPQDLWNQLPKTVIDEYVNSAKKDYDQYKIDIEEWYKKHPEDYQNDQLIQKQKKQKRYLQQNIDKKLYKYVENPTEIMFYVGNLLKFNVPIKSTPKVKNMLQAYYQKLDDDYIEQLERTWVSFEPYQQLAIFQWYSDWISKKYTKQVDDQE